MSEILLSPPIAFFIFLALAAGLYGFGRLLAGKNAPSAAKSSLYAGGETDHLPQGAPGYRPFFTIALFFAILHLGVLMIGSGRMPVALDHARRGLEERLGVPVEAIDPTTFATLSDRISVTPELMTVLAPLAGILMRTHREAVTA